MKKILKYSSLLMCAVLMTWGCDAPDPVVTPEAIHITLTGQPPVTAYPDETVSYAFSVEYANGLKNIAAYLDGQEIAQSFVEYSEAPTATEYTFDYVVDSKQAGNTLGFVVTVTGVDGVVRNIEYPLYVRAAKPDITIVLPKDAPEESNVNNKLEFEVSISTSVAFKQIATYKDGIIIPELTKTTFANPNEDTYAFTYTPMTSDIGQTVTFRFEVMDANGNIVSGEYAVKFFRPAPAEISEFFGVVMGYQNCPTHGPFLNVATGDVYAVKNSHLHCTDIDIVLYWSANAKTVGAALTSVSSDNAKSTYNQANVSAVGGSEEDIIGNWPTRNVTTFKMMSITESEFGAITSKSEIESYYNDSQSAEVVVLVQLQPKNIIGFKTADGKCGILNIVAREAVAKVGTFTIDYKIVK